MKLNLLLFFGFLVLMPIAFGGIDCTHQCSSKACLEGTDINFTVTVYNNLKDSITVDNVYVKDVETSKVLALDVRPEEIILSEQTRQFTLRSTVLAPARGYTFYYVPCFRAKQFNDSGVLGDKVICGKTIKSLTVMPLNKMECRTDKECSEDNYCNTNSLYKCRPLKCSGNQTIESHRCVDLACNSLQYSKDHECVYNKALLGGIVLSLFIAVTLVLALIMGLRPKRKVKHK